VTGAGRYICERCATTYPAPGSCPHHRDEPLLDLTRDDVRDLLADIDYRARMKRLFASASIAVAITVPLFVGLMIAFNVWLASQDPDPYDSSGHGSCVGHMAAGGAVVGCAIGWVVTRLTFKPRFRDVLENPPPE
jgi:hypothetical protein